MERRLAAVLNADVVGYSRLMSANETGTLRSLKRCETENIEPTVANHKGRIVKRMGDGYLAEFASRTERSITSSSPCAFSRSIRRSIYTCLPWHTAQRDSSIQRF